MLVKKIKDLLDDNPLLARLYKNAGILFSGNAISALISLLALAVITRALSLEDFGIYALITAYISLIDRLVNFQTWQALIRYGAKALQEKENNKLTYLLLFGYLIDVSSGLLGFLIATLGIIFIPDMFGLESVDKSIIFISLSVIMFNWISTSIAILSIFNKFHYQALYLNLTSFLKLGGFVALFMMGITSLGEYIIVWAVSTLIGRFFLFFISWREARKNNLLHIKQVNFGMILKKGKRLWKFIFATNLDSVVRILRDIDIFIVNSILGDESTGVYKVARELARIPSQITSPFSQAICPDLSRLVSTKDWCAFKLLIKQSSITIGSLISAGVIIFALIGSWAINFIFGDAFIDAFPITLLCLISVAIGSFFLPLAPAFMAIEKVHINLVVNIIASIVYIMFLWLSLNMLGLIGAGVSLVLFYVTWSLIMFFIFNRIFKKVIG